MLELRIDLTDGINWNGQHVGNRRLSCVNPQNIEKFMYENYFNSASDFQHKAAQGKN